jgi:hypothetical protein
MSLDYKPVYVLDPRCDVTDTINYGVNKGGAQLTTSKFQATSKSTSQLVWSVQVPSETTIIDRRAMVEFDVTLNITGTVDLSGYLVNIGVGDALASFPGHRLISTWQTTINNNTVNLAVNEALDAFVRSNDERELYKFNSTTPVAYDQYYSYAQAVQANNNPNGAYLTAALDNALQGRGSFYLNPADISGNAVGTGAGQARTVSLRFRVIEPIICSPFIFSDPHNQAGIYGVQNMSFVANLNANARRAFRTSNANITNVSIVSVNEANLYFNFITPQPSMLLPQRNVVPYQSYPRYVTRVDRQLLANETATITSSTITLNQVPDALFIYVRKAYGTLNANDADAWLPIKNISVNFNNQAGLLSSSSQMDLFRMSKKAGYNGNWLEFSGRAIRANSAGKGDPVALATSGSMLMLQFGEDIALSQDWLASGSIGNYTLQFDLQVENNTGGTINSGAYELVLLTKNSGVFVCERGTSSIYEALLSRQQVLDATQQEPYSKKDVQRMVGGSIFDVGRFLMKNIKPIAGVAKAVLPALGPKGAMAANVLGALGAGRTGAGRTGAGVSGGRLMDRLMD